MNIQTLLATLLNRVIVLKRSVLNWTMTLEEFPSLTQETRASSALTSVILLRRCSHISLWEEQRTTVSPKTLKYVQINLKCFHLWKRPLEAQSHAQILNRNLKLNKTLPICQRKSHPENLNFSLREKLNLGRIHQRALRRNQWASFNKENGNLNTRRELN